MRARACVCYRGAVVEPPMSLFINAAATVDINEPAKQIISLPGFRTRVPNKLF